jgi:YihY family inner membrane protein
MNLPAKFKHRLYLLLDRPGAGPAARFLRHQIDLWTLCWRHLSANNVLSMSSALSFRTIFAMIPALVLALLVTRSVGAFGDPREQVRRFLDSLGLPRIVVAVHEQPQTPGPDGEAASWPSSQPSSPPWVDRAPQEQREIDLAAVISHSVERIDRQLTLGRIGPAGVLLLAWSAITLMMTLDQSVNRVFCVRRQRPFWRRLLIYCSALTLLPLIVAVGAYSLARFAAPLETLPYLHRALGVAGWLIWLAVTFGGLALLYKLLPNTPVGFACAVRGAALAVPLWLLAHWGLSIYIARFVGKGNLYGALGLLPLFLMWLNILWWIFLLGAAMAYVMANLRRTRDMDLGQPAMPGPLDMLAMMLLVGRSFELGKKPVRLGAISSEASMPEYWVEPMLDRLVRSKLLCQAGENQRAYLPSRPASKVSVLEVLQAGGAAHRGQGRYDEQVARALKQVESKSLAAVADLSLANLMEQVKR